MDEKDAIIFVINLHEIEKSGFSLFSVVHTYAKTHTHRACLENSKKIPLD